MSGLVDPFGELFAAIASVPLVETTDAKFEGQYHEEVLENVRDLKSQARHAVTTFGQILEDADGHGDPGTWLAGAGNAIWFLNELCEALDEIERRILEGKS